MRNPGSVIPFPSPNDIPEPGQFSVPKEVRWEPQAAAPQDTILPYFTATWASKTYDLRPGFRGVPMADAPAAGAASVWRPYGAGGQLLVQISTVNPIGIGHQDFNITAWDEAHPYDVSNLRQVTQLSNVTTQFTTFVDLAGGGGWSGLGAFSPVGVGSPVRFWRLRMLFEIGGVTGQLPKIRIVEGYY
jgi:hypothetical protein